MHEYFYFKPIWAHFANMFYFMNAEFARQYNPVNAHIMPKLDALEIRRIGLGAQCNEHIGQRIPHAHQNAGICYDQAVDAETAQFLRAGQHRADVVIMRCNV